MRRLSAILLLVLVGCGKPAQILSPTDGQTFQLEQFSGFQVILQNNDYQNTSTEFRGAEALTGSVSCTGGSGSMGQCMPNYASGFGGGSFGTSCTQDKPCVVTIAVRRNGKTQVDSLISVRFVRGGATTSYPPAR